MAAERRNSRLGSQSKGIMISVYSKRIVCFIAFLVIFSAVSRQVFCGEESKSEEKTSELKISPPVVPAPEDQAYWRSSQDNLPGKKIGTCGNRIMEGDEGCDDGNVESGDGCSAICKRENIPICGNRTVEEGEQCESDGDCREGEHCTACRCISTGPAVCGNGIREGNEECDGEDGTCPNNFHCGPACTCIAECAPAVCPAGEIQDPITCRCMGPQCGTMVCPSEPRCAVSYCRDASGACVFQDPILINPDPASLPLEPYGQGTVEVSECCTSVTYRTLVKYDPCTGIPIESTYQVEVVATSPTSGEQCHCPPQEPGGSGGQPVGCEEAVDSSLAVRVDQIFGQAPPRIRIECSDCCGNLRTTERSFSPAPLRGPVSCGYSNCPSEPSAASTGEI